MVPNKPKKRRAHPPRCCGKHCQNAQQDCGRDPQPHTLDTHSSCCARQQTQGRYAIPSVHQMRPTAHENATAALHAHTHTLARQHAMLVHVPSSNTHKHKRRQAAADAQQQRSKSNSIHTCVSQSQTKPNPRQRPIGLHWQEAVTHAPTHCLCTRLMMRVARQHDLGPTLPVLTLRMPLAHKQTRGTPSCFAAASWHLCATQPEGLGLR